MHVCLMLLLLFLQRVPVTEKSGRVHTSAVSVAILPQADEVIGFFVFAIICVLWCGLLLLLLLSKLSFAGRCSTEE